MEKKEKIEQIKEKEIKYIDINDLTASEIKKLDFYVVTFTKDTGKNNDNYYSNIQVRLNDIALQQMVLNNRGKRISLDEFDYIKLMIDLPDFDERNYKQRQWKREVPIRFVKGNWKDINGNITGNYYSMEVIFSKELHIVHYFSKTQKNLIDILMNKHKIDFKFVTRPEAINEIEVLDDY